MYKLNSKGLIHAGAVIGTAGALALGTLAATDQMRNGRNQNTLSSREDRTTLRENGQSNNRERPRGPRPPRDGGGNNGGGNNGGGNNGGGNDNPQDGIQPYADAPACEDIGLVHDDRAWHGIWDYENGCHWDHEHKMNPHDMDDVFGTKVYDWAGGEVSYPWQTFMGASDSFEEHQPGTCTENGCKHEGNKWLHFRDRDSAEDIRGALLLGAHAITDARVQYHQIGGQKGALTRFHSVWVEAKSCFNGEVSDETCGIYRGGGHLDFGRLNHPERGIYAPLPGDPAEFANTPAELEPYRIHPIGKNSLDSWQSKGNHFNYLPEDPTGSRRLKVGHGIHFIQGESPSETDPEMFGVMNPDEDFWCLDEETGLFTCSNNNSQAALFRTWVGIPKALDGSEYDEDGEVNGYFTFHGYTNRYGDIVEDCTETGLDCVPAEAENFPIGGCNHPEGRCWSAFRGSAGQDTYEADVSPAGVNWIKYPN